LADGGTLFLDEIGDMSMSLQAKILRILEEQEFERVGGSEVLKVNVRIITATNKDLLFEVQNERFRKDLYYRINVYPIYLPPLRERKEDIPLLVSYFIEKMAQKNNKNVRSITPRALKMLTEYAWHGNVRELENVIERAVLLSSGYDLDASHFSLVPLGEIEKSAQEKTYEEKYAFPGPLDMYPTDESGILSMEEVEKRYLEHAMRITHGNISRAAHKLKIGRSTLYRKLEKYNLLKNE
jgi:transcriptional regulator with GAF, ATPase, and Fis domain